jgi:hypothetical protein
LLHFIPTPLRAMTLWVCLLGALLLLANGWLAQRLATKLWPESKGGAATLAAAFVLFYYPLVFWTLRGFEVGLISLCAQAMFLCAFRLAEQPRLFLRVALWICAVVAVLTRVDALLPCLAVAAYLALAAPSGRREALALLAIAGSTLALHSALRIEYYGAPLPNTYYLKMEGIGLWPRLSRGTFMLAVQLVRHFSPMVVLAAALCVGARHAPRDKRILALAFWLVLTLAYSVYVGGDVWERLGFANRFVACAAPALALLSVAGLRALLGFDEASMKSWLRLLCLAFCAAALAVGIGTLVTERQLPPLLQALPSAKLVFGSAALVAALAAGALAGTFSRRFAPPLVRMLRRLSGGGWRRPSRAWAAAGALALVVNSPAWGGWLLHNFHMYDWDAGAVRIGVALSQQKSKDTRIALTAAGAIPYFSGMPTVDLLGKSDPVIAHQMPRTRKFVPGHDKWDLARSLGELKPDLIVDLPSEVSAEELRYVRELGYAVSADGWLVRFPSENGAQSQPGADFAGPRTPGAR